MTRLFGLVVLFVALAQGNKLGDYQYDQYNGAIDYDYNNHDYQDQDSTKTNEVEVVEDVITVLPKITSQPENIVTDIGTSFRLPCLMDNLPEQISVIWRRPDTAKKEIVAIGSLAYNNYKDRVEIETTEKGSVLIVGVATVEDAGQYECDLAVDNQKGGSVTHTVSIRVAPKIVSEVESYIEAEVGKDVELECKGTGTPQPTVKWTKASGKMMDGRKEVVGEKLLISNINRHHAGHYKCTAENGFSKSATKEVEVRVLYAPEIVVEEVFIHTKAGKKAELVCSVHGFPRPEVKWTKDGQPVSEQANKIKIQNINHKHSLIISSVAKSDFGSYTCHAKSERGQAEKTIEISGLAKPAEFTSAPAGKQKTKYLLEWKVRSYTPVTSFRVETRILGTDAWQEHIQKPHADGAYHYAGKLLLKDLAAAERYEARVMARNEEGWNKQSKIFNYATLGAEPKQEGVISSSSKLLPSLLLILIAAKIL